MISDDDLLQMIVEARLRDPDGPHRMAQVRRPPRSWETRRLLLVAADHPARRTVAAGSQAWAMANRADLLRRVARVLMQPFVDGVLATPDVLEELYLVNAWAMEHGGPDFLQDKILIGSMNRGGLSDTVFEFDDFVSAYSTQALLDQHLDAGKLLLRLAPDHPDSAKTLQYVAAALASLDEAHLPVFLEPIPVPLSVDDLVKLVGVASALGPTSRRRWLKVPMITPFERIARATTCPLVLLGGADTDAFDVLVERVSHCLDAGPNVRGVLMGRSVLYPPDHRDPREVMARLAALIHGEGLPEVVSWPNL